MPGCFTCADRKKRCPREYDSEGNCVECSRLRLRCIRDEDGKNMSLPELTDFRQERLRATKESRSAHSRSALEVQKPSSTVTSLPNHVRGVGPTNSLNASGIAAHQQNAGEQTLPRDISEASRYTVIQGHESLDDIFDEWSFGPTGNAGPGVSRVPQHQITRPQHESDEFLNSAMNPSLFPPAFEYDGDHDYPQWPGFIVAGGPNASSTDVFSASGPGIEFLPDGAQATFPDLGPPSGPTWAQWGRITDSRTSAIPSRPPPRRSRNLNPADSNRHVASGNRPGLAYESAGRPFNESTSSMNRGSSFVGGMPVATTSGLQNIPTSQLMPPPPTDDPEGELNRFQRYIWSNIPGVARIVIEVEGDDGVTRGLEALFERASAVGPVAIDAVPVKRRRRRHPPPS